MGDNEDALPTLIIDIGSDIKCGYGGEDAPRKVFSAVLGWPKHPGVGGVMLGAKKDVFVGDDVRESEGLLRTVHPVERGVIKDWSDMDKVMHHLFYSELVVAPDEHPLLLSTAPDTSKADKEKFSELLFESFNCPALVLANQGCTSLFSSGRSTGLVLDSGEGVTHLTPVWEGYSLPHYIGRLELAGSDLTKYLVQLLRARGLPFSTPDDFRIAEDIKEKLCYLSADYSKELQNAEVSRSFERFYKMPDGSEIRLCEDRFRCPEALFTPSMIGLSCSGVHTMVNECILKCDSFIQKEMYDNIVLSGGNTLFPAFDDRLTKEVQALSSSAAVRVTAFPERRYAAWLGGSLLASLPTFPTMWLAKKEYDEVGVSAIHKKAF
eukprot:TRINITY_DN30201_c0_g1_i1.p1 TRINITY_DN30201_c0_g1~~TRINITY_DN30201_c0_g1_i1.p1  ORF type:complete len:379 (+),score=63.51 TRINITY_DN30201_c0_g1_i1:33-1169(+)